MITSCQKSELINFAQRSNIVYNNEALQQFALSIVPNQIWLIKTNSGQFGKLLTIKTKIDIIDDNKPFAELELKIAKIE